MKPVYVILGVVALGVVGYFAFGDLGQHSLFTTQSANEPSAATGRPSNAWGSDTSAIEVTQTLVASSSTNQNSRQARNVYETPQLLLPLSGSAPTSKVRYTIPISEIKQGCARQDCIPSVDDPEFMTVPEAEAVLSPDSIGIALQYQGQTRFYPFAMLETRELVNDVVGGVPVLVSYCPLCGTGIVFDRRVDGEVYEFGVSGMLWQSNLLMYNRAENVQDHNLWSQVLGQAVVGNRAGEDLTIIPSDIVQFSEWKTKHPNARVLTTGEPRDPYNGEYFRVANSFNPDFDAAASPLPPMAYVYGVIVNGVAQAYPRDELPVGVTTDMVDGVPVSVTKQSDGTVTITTPDGPVPDVEGFWFSWVAAHPDTLLYSYE